MDRLNKVPGVYVILFSDRETQMLIGSYVSSGVNMYNSQYNHLSSLRIGKHYNPKVQEYYNKYETHFLCLEECLKEELVNRKQIYLDIIKPNLNLLIDGRTWKGYHHTKTSNAKNSRKNYLKSQDPKIKEIVSKTWFKEGNQLARRKHNRKEI